MSVFLQTYRPDRMAQEPMPGERRGYKFHFTYLPGRFCISHVVFLKNNVFFKKNPGVDNETYLLEDEEEHMLPGGMDLYIHDAEQWFTGIHEGNSGFTIFIYSYFCMGNSREPPPVHPWRALVRPRRPRGLHQAVRGDLQEPGQGGGALSGESGGRVQLH